MRKLAKKKTGGEDPKLTKAKQDSVRGAQNIDVLISSTKGMNTTSYKTAVKKAQDLMKKPAQVRKELGIKKTGGTTKSKSKK